MGPEDEGTPPCQERLLANECSSPAYHAERHVDEGWEAEYEQPVETAKRSGWKSYLPMASSTKRTATENGVDLVKLLNENWYEPPLCLCVSEGLLLRAYLLQR